MTQHHVVLCELLHTTCGMGSHHYVASSALFDTALHLSSVMVLHSRLFIFALSRSRFTLSVLVLVFLFYHPVLLFLLSLQVVPHSLPVHVLVHFQLISFLEIASCQSLLSVPSASFYLVGSFCIFSGPVVFCFLWCFPHVDAGGW